MEMNQTLARQIENAFPKWIRYGMMPNPNMKYCKQGYRTLIVAVFPYSYPQKTTAFSKYASIPDYHRVVKEELAAIFDPLGVEYLSFTDISPFPEKQLAQELGLGQIGKHNLLLTKDYGSFVFIGEVLLKEELPEKKYQIPELCTGCGACVSACPTNSLEYGFCKGSCLSFLTQKKTLTPQEEAMLQKGDTLWGCDLCQLVCPVTKNAVLTGIDAFQKPVLELTKEKLKTLTPEEFQEIYHDFAFCYKGIEILKRNARLLDEKEI